MRFRRKNSILSSLLVPSLLFVLIVYPPLLYGQNSLVEENFLHPADAFSGYTMGENEIAWNIPVIPPSPGWIWWGITDRITVELDIEANLGGVPSINMRFGIIRSDTWALAVETMYQHVPRKLDFDYFEEDDGTDISVKRYGSSWYNHLNLSLRPLRNLYFHLSLGCIYQKELVIKRRSSTEQHLFTDTVNPDASLGIDWRTFDSFALICSASYGATFIYLDNIPRKTQIAGGFRWAPFIHADCSFLNTMRIEATMLYIRFHDIDKTLVGPIGFIYWQWYL